MVQAGVEKKLVQNESKYFNFILELRNHPKLKEGFIEQAIISFEEHENYMAEYGKSYYICLLGHELVGYVGVIEDDIRIAVHPDYQQLGLGKFMVSEIMKIYPNAHAKVKVTNRASRHLFEGLGFTEKYVIYESTRIFR
jgi:ribosomal protein S18 acetylase RimI-like enzyme